MDAAAGEMFSLNAAGRLLWQSLPASTEALAARLCSEYQLSEAQAREDVTALLSDLEERGLIRRS